MSRTSYSHSKKQNSELLFIDLFLNRNKLKEKLQFFGYKWQIVAAAEISANCFMNDLMKNRIYSDMFNFICVTKISRE